MGEGGDGRLIGWVVGLVCVALVGGCVGRTPTAEPVSIVFADPQMDQALFGGWLALFQERYPHIAVELRAGGSEEADVFRVSAFELSELVEAGSLRSLGAFLEPDPAVDLADYYPGSAGLFTVQGQVWALPVGVDVVVAYYNRDLFDQYGVPYPEAGWTWDDFLATAMALRDPGEQVFGYAPTDATFDPLSIIYQRGGRILDDLNAPTRTTFDDPLTIAALDWYAGLMHRHNVAPTQQQAREASFGGTARAGVYRGKVGMWLAWLSQRGGSADAAGDWPGEWEMRWGVVPVPRHEGGATLAMADGYAIAAPAEHPDACWQWISFLSGQMQRGAVPARRSLAESDAYREQVGSEVADAARGSLERAVLLSPGLMAFWGDLEYFGRALDSVSRGTATAEEALVNAQRHAEER